MPAAIRFGIPLDVFWNLNPKYMNLYQQEYIRDKEEQMKMLDISAYYNGFYVQRAISACFSRKIKYPKKPLSLMRQEKQKEEELSKSDYYEAMRSMIQRMNEGLEKQGKKVFCEKKGLAGED